MKILILELCPHLRVVFHLVSLLQCFKERLRLLSSGGEGGGEMTDRDLLSTSAACSFCNFKFMRVFPRLPPPPELAPPPPPPPAPLTASGEQDWDAEWSRLLSVAMQASGNAPPPPEAPVEFLFSPVDDPEEVVYDRDVEDDDEDKDEDGMQRCDLGCRRSQG